MSRTTARTMLLLHLLTTGRSWPGDELCRRLEVSQRTLRRDVEDLRALGYGIEAGRGVGGGYRIGPGAAIPPLTLSPDEAVAIAVGLRAVTVGAVHGLEEAAAGALAKLEQSLASETRERIATVAGALVPLGGAGGVDAETVRLISRSIRESRQLPIEYRRDDGTEVRRTVQPHRIVHTADRWYLIAWDVDREDWRTLRVDRLRPVLPFAGRFRARVIPEEQLRRFISQSVAVRPWPRRAVLRVHASADRVREHFGPTLAAVFELDGGSCRLDVGGETWEQVAVYVGTAGMDFEVLEGDGLRDALRALGSRLVRAAAA